jgi:hypothetical protein
MRGLIAILAGAFCAVSAQADDHHEVFILYANAGPSIPVSETKYGESYEVGFHGGGGIGLPTSQGDPVSLELILRVEYNHFPGKGVVEDNSGSILFEGKLRNQVSRRFRPYFTIGFGGFPQIIGVGFGTDIAVDDTGMFLLYAEMKYLDAVFDQIRFDFGLRLG